MATATAAVYRAGKSPLEVRFNDNIRRANAILCVTGVGRRRRGGAGRSAGGEGQAKGVHGATDSQGSPGENALQN